MQQQNTDSISRQEPALDAPEATGYPEPAPLPAREKKEWDDLVDQAAFEAVQDLFAPPGEPSESSPDPATAAEAPEAAPQDQAESDTKADAEAPRPDDESAPSDSPDSAANMPAETKGTFSDTLFAILRNWRKWIFFAAALLVLLAFVVFYALGTRQKREAKPDYLALAAEAAAQNDFERAWTYAQQDGTPEGAERARAYSYASARALFDAGDYYDAANAFNALGDYEDAKERMSESLYREAEKLLADGHYEAALARYNILGDYKDAAEKAANMDALEYDALAAGGDTAGVAEKLFIDGRAEEAIALCDMSGRLALSGSGLAALPGDGTVRYFGSEKSELAAIENWTNIQKLSAGNVHIVGIGSDGTVKILGANVVGDKKDRYQPTAKQKWTEIVDAAAGGYAYMRSVLNLHGARPLIDTHFTAIVRADGTVDMQPRPGYKTLMFKTVSAWRDVVAIDGAGDNVIALHADGTASAANATKTKKGPAEAVNALVADWTELLRVTADGSGFYGLDKSGTLHFARLSGKTGETPGVLGMDSGAVSTIVLLSDGTVYSTDERADLSGWKDITAVFAGSTGFSGNYGDQKDYYAGLRSDGTLVYYNLPRVILTDPALSELILTK